MSLACSQVTCELKKKWIHLGMPSLFRSRTRFPVEISPRSLTAGTTLDPVCRSAARVLYCLYMPRRPDGMNSFQTTD